MATDDAIEVSDGLEDFHLLVGNENIPPDKRVHIHPGVKVSVDDILVDGELRVDGMLYVFGSLSGSGTVLGNGTIKLVS